MMKHGGLTRLLNAVTTILVAYVIIKIYIADDACKILVLSLASSRLDYISIIPYCLAPRKPLLVVFRTVLYNMAPDTYYTYSENSVLVAS